MHSAMTPLAAMRNRRWPRHAALAALGLSLLAVYGLATRHGPALADEFIYLAGARHLATTGSLDARYYDANAILRQGHPHQDNHSPGYVILLGGLTWLFKGSYWTAVALGAAAYLSAPFLVGSLSRRLGFDERAAWVAGALVLVLPPFLPYVYWALAESVLPSLFLLTLVVAARSEGGLRGGFATGLLFGFTFLVRESALFGLPAVLALLKSRRAVAAALVAAVLFGVFVYAPLGRRRSAGASNFWDPSSGKEFGFQVVKAAREGDLPGAIRGALARARGNLDELASGSTNVERGILLALALLPALAVTRWREWSPRQRLFLAALLAGWLGIVGVMTCVYVLARWAGFRYILFLAPPFLPFLAVPARRLRYVPVVAFALFSIGLDLGVFRILTDFKVSRQKRQSGIAAYVERYLDPRGLVRIALPNGWLFGLKHYPVEVISSLPEGGAELRMLERAVWFDALVLPGDTELQEEMKGRAKYRRLNGEDVNPPLLVYRRLR
jgi:hypothetical protein